jgi:predicted XRE-type DNA-binding protein
MSIDLEYAIKQDVRNNPVVREVDREQKREFVRMLGGAALAVAVLIFVVAPKTSSAALGHHVEDLREAIAQELEVQRHLRVQLATELRPQAVQQRATTELKMVEPSEQNIVVIERVPASPKASRAIVASRR